MAPSIIASDAVQGEAFLPGQIFVFGSFALRANSLGHLEQIESYAPGHQVGFGNLNYTADIRGDLIFDGFEPVSGAPHSHDEHDVTLSSDSVQEITPATTLAFNPEQFAPSEDGWIDPAMEVALSVATEPNTDSPLTRVVLPNHWIRLRPWTPSRLHLCLSNPIGCRSWSSPPRISFSTHLSEMC